MARLITLAETSKAVAAATARSAKIETLAAHLRQLDPAELAIAVRYLSGETRQGRIGIGYSALRASAAAAADDPSLRLCDVDRYLEELAAVRGAGSAARRAALLREMFGRATGEEQDFLLRLLTGELRQGALSGVMIEAIAAAVQLPLAELRRAAMYANDLGVVARVAVEEGAAGLQSFQLQTMSPIVPMLAQTAVDVEEALERLAGDVAFDWKLDGARIQLHKRGDDIRVFTRSLNDVTSAIPEIVEAARALPAESWCWMERPSVSPRTVACIRSRRRCGASAASSTWSGCATSYRCARSTSIACGGTSAALRTVRCANVSRRW